MTYRAAVFTKDKTCEIVQKQSQPLKHGQARVKTTCCGVCHTDLHVRDQEFGNSVGRVGGHEGVGIVTEISPDVKSLKVGDRVSIAWLFSACGACEQCIAGREAMCSNQTNPGLSADGAFAEEVVVAADYAVKVPEGLDDGAASSVTCAGVTVYKAIKEAHIIPGQVIALWGLGGLGSLAVQIAKSYNCKIIALDVNDRQLEFAKANGADHVINSRDGVAAAKEIQDKFGGAHACVITATAVPAFEAALNSVRPFGRVVAVGLPSKLMQLSIPNLVLKGIQLVGSIVGTRNDLAEAFQLAKAGFINPTTAPRKLEDIDEIMEEMQKGTITGRMVVYF
ncbi:Alcohol dehydrogenase 1 [Wickerhamiella sorbophila]|uniref:Alcohol dehydrogenase 1 n=1 Tax=Wickerhamiella sorbophila TaxID=45607 RepID=A0A2T0FLQ3_9ASCO|nr:Alcohol dehydrogenase 1 [Wickerhamiella sorbophila]PRT55918.1 Alcohol dehydrogenase 1 [Wickerhamiella sorbophila]